MELARIVYWEYDPHTDELIFNDPFYAFYGTTAEQEGGYRMSAPVYGARFIHPDDLPRYTQRSRTIRRPAGIRFGAWNTALFEGTGRYATSS